MTETYAGSTLSLVAGAPATFDVAGYELLTFVTGACSLWEVPNINREWDKVTEDLVCGDGTSFDVKGGSKYPPVQFKMTRRPGDAAQVIYQTLEQSNSAVGSFKLELPGDAGIYYFTAQVSKFTYVDGGGKNTIHTASVELLIQSLPVYDAAA